MDFAAQLFKDEEKLISLKKVADELIDQYNNNQKNQLVHLYNMKIRRYQFEYNQIIEKEKLEHQQYENKIDFHVTILSNILAVELLSEVEQYVDKQHKWLKRKQYFIQKYDAVTSFLAIQRKFYEIEYDNLVLYQELKKKHLSELNKLHMEQLHELNLPLLYQNIEALHKQQNVEISQFLYYQQKYNAVIMEHLKKEDELAVVISKIQVKDQLPLFDDNINMLKNGYYSLHCKIPSLPKINKNVPLENQTIILEEIYYQFYSLQQELIKMYPKMIDTALEMNKFLISKDIDDMFLERVNFLQENPRTSFDD